MGLVNEHMSRQHAKDRVVAAALKTFGAKMGNFDKPCSVDEAQIKDHRSANAELPWLTDKDLDHRISNKVAIVVRAAKKSIATRIAAEGVEPMNEVFDQPYPHTKHGALEYEFQTPNDNYHMGFDHLTLNHDWPNKHAEAAFSSEKGRYSHSGAERENSHKVFSTVHNIIKQHLADNPDVKSLGFSASKGGAVGNDGSRATLYRHMIKKFAHKHTEQHTDYDVNFRVNRGDIKD